MWPLLSAPSRAPLLARCPRWLYLLALLATQHYGLIWLCFALLYLTFREY